MRHNQYIFKLDFNFCAVTFLKLANCIAKRLADVPFSLHTPFPQCHLPYNEKEKELCRSVILSTGINYAKFHDSTVRQLSVQGLNIIVMKKARSENWRYDAENGNQSQRVIHHFLQENNANKVPKISFEKLKTKKS